MRTSLVLARFAVLSTISVICALALSPTLARAEDTVAPPADDTVAGDDENFFAPADTKKKPDVPDASAFNTGEDDLKIAAPVEVTPPPPKPVVVAAGPSKLGLDLNGKTPLADNWGPAVVFTTADSVVVELPVLYAVNGAGFDGNAYWLLAEVYSDGKKIGEERAQVMKETVSTKGPSVQFFRFFTPVGAPTGVLEVKVSKIASGSTKPSLLFTRSVSYTL